VLTLGGKVRCLIDRLTEPPAGAKEVHFLRLTDPDEKITPENV